MRQPKRELSRGGKLSDQTIRNFIIHFAWGQPFEEVAGALCISRKTVRILAAYLRARLLTPVFNPWHMLLDLWPNEPTQDISSHQMLTLILAECANSRCGRNFRLGNVAKRQCRGCILRGYVDEKDAQTHIGTIDGVHDFYEHLGWRNDLRGATFDRYRLRTAHFLTVRNAARHSRKLKSGLGDPSETGYLTTGTLIARLLESLIENPLPFVPVVEARPPNNTAARAAVDDYEARLMRFALGNDYFRKTLEGGFVAFSHALRRTDKTTRAAILSQIQAYIFELSPYEDGSSGQVSVEGLEPVHWTIDIVDDGRPLSLDDPKLLRVLKIELKSEVRPPTLDPDWLDDE